MSNANWKALERKIAKVLGGRRVGNPGKSLPDVVAWDGYLLVECKFRASVPQWLTSAVTQARGYAAARGPDRLGIAVIHEKGQRHGGDLVCLRLDDFVEWFGGAGES